ncbi:glycosyltransferase family 1 protein [Latilactobacillus sakei]|uniref:glycosyltransferase family 1 protein n=1 Tax=Latilactobacillus sakei TaxID=1599 RepID=UPI000C13177C|nr:glycosyltransferase family 1 protein [Latilactobacillus sakei]SOB39868.1 Capsular polysaccharide biosynthesis protein [Latilactobacillus sakei]
METKKKKVLHYVARMDRAGQETFIMNIFRNIDRNKVEFGFLCSIDGEGDYDKEILSLGGNIFHVRLNRLNNKFKQIDNFFLLYRYLKKIDYDVFHIHTQHAMDAFLSSLAAKLAGFNNVIVHSHNTSTDFHIKAHYIFRFFLNLLNINRYACSVDAGKWMFNKKNCLVVHNGVDINKYRPDELTRNRIRKQYKIEDKFVYGHVGRFSDQKNHRKLIEIFDNIQKRNENSILLLIGTGELKDEIKSKVEEKHLEDKVYFLGVQENTNDFYKAMDAFLLPSLYEGLSVALVEAQATGLPCYISDTISRESDITSNIFRIGLTKDSDQWAQEILADRQVRNRQDIKDDSVSEIKNAKYDISEIANMLQQKYLDM